jgi:maleylacetate reductase
MLETASEAIDFAYTAPATRVLLGVGRAAELSTELERLGGERAMVACTQAGAQRYRKVIEYIGTRCAAVFDRAEPHCPQSVAEEVLARFDAERADSIVTIGGGSTIALGKFVAAKRGTPCLAVPTTLSGSEMTSLYGIKVGDEKRTTNDPAARPRTVVYDPSLTETLPKHETATSGMNCLAHCVEALYPASPNPVARLLALDGIRTLSEALPSVIERNDVGSRAKALYAGFVGGSLVAMVGIGLHHKICHVLGGNFDIAHGDSNSVILPYVVAFNAPAIPKIAQEIAAALGAKEAAVGIDELARKIGAPTNLRELGVPICKLQSVTREVVAKDIYNPRPIDFDNIFALLKAAWNGTLDS